MRGDHLRFGRSLLTHEEIERARLQVLRNDAAWVRQQMTDGRAVNGVYMIDHPRLMRVVEFMEKELKEKLGADYVVGQKPTCTRV